MKWFITGLSLLSFTLIGALAGAPQANAASEYDNSLVVVEEPFKFRSGTTSAYDFGQWIATTSFSACQAEINLFKDMVSAGTGYYWVSQMTYASYPNEQSFFINWTGNKTETIDTSWSTSSLQFGRYPNGFNQIQIDVGPSYTNPYCRNETSFTFSNTERTFQWYRAVETNFSIEYPAGYEGDTITPIAPPVEYVDYVPKFYASVSNKWKASIHDTNFNTFDGVPFTCEGGLAPVLHYELWNMNVDPEVKLSEGVQSATAQIDYQFPENSVTQDYRVVGWYDCGSDDPLQFNESSFFDFSINGTGQLHVLGLETCLIDGFPFFDIEACTVGLNSTLALLAFQSANPVNEGVLGTATSANTSGCYTMGTLGGWINRPGQVICPGFSNTVRTVVTPFVTVVLAMVVFFYISRGRGVTID